MLQGSQAEVDWVVLPEGTKVTREITGHLDDLYPNLAPLREMAIVQLKISSPHLSVMLAVCGEPERATE